LAKGSFKHNQQCWIVKCRCGKETEVASQHLRSAVSTKCIQCAGKVASEKKYRTTYQAGGSRIKWIQKRMEDLYAKQNAMCPVCDRQLPTFISSCALDHDHSTGEGRALLHRGCNVFVGMIENHPNILDNVKNYLGVD